jgi:hypothetical protein
MEPNPSNSIEQRDAEPLMIAALSRELGVSLEPREVPLPGGQSPRVDGVCESPFILCEAWAHQGLPKGAQPMKVMTDAMKLLYIERVLARPARKILLFSDAEAAAPFLGDGWRADALNTFGIEVRVVEIDDRVRQRVAEAQVRQYR